jgi:two-component system, sensor histidine kinase and response regulator
MSQHASSPARGSAPRPPLRILLAEDNVTNQKLAVAILEKQGHTIKVVADGKQAIEAYERELFDVVLMDMQMPEVDGLEATSAIRSLEKSSGRHTPIIALTANAMIGDRERCLNSGMDEYLSKPLRADDLFATIERLVVPQALTTTTPQGQDISGSASNAIFDYNTSVQQVGDDPELLSQLVAVFLEQLPLLLPPLETAVATNDAKAIRQAAHALCSSVSVIAAPRAKDIARKLELMGLNSELDRVRETHAELLSEFSALQQVLNTTPSLKAA